MEIQIHLNEGSHHFKRRWKYNDEVLKSTSLELPGKLQPNFVQSILRWKEFKFFSFVFKNEMIFFFQINVMV